jgi:PAS domain S-box-containing protein
MDGRYGGEDFRKWRLRVLIVEDFEDDALLLLRELRNGGYSPDFERVDTHEAMSAALEHRTWDVVLCDHSMPKFSSTAALQLLRESGFPDLPFIIVSGRIGEDAAVAAMKSGAQDYIMKDNLTRLNSAIERELREAEGRRERRRAEENLLRSERGLAAAQRIARLGNFDYHPESDAAVWSDELFRICGLDPQQFVPTYRSFLHLAHPEDRSIVRNAVREALYGAFENTVEYRIVRPSGETRIVQTAYEAHRDSEGNAIAIRLTGTVQDITERKKAEEARRLAEDKYRSIFENAIEGIFQSTVEGELVTANPALARMAGYESPEEMLRKVPMIEDRLYENPSRRRELYEIMRRDGSISGFEVRMRRADDSLMWASFSIQSVLNASGALIGFEGTVEDVTERKNAEANLRAMRESERQRIARDLHDEALQDLTYALQATRVMRRIGGSGDEISGNGPPLDGLVEALDRAVGGLRTAIYDLRLEEDERRSLVESVERLIEVHSSIAPECSVELFVFGDGNRLSAKLPATARRDLLRIIQESLVNVRRHSQASHATIRLGLEGERIGVEVSDDGRGFDPRAKPGMGLTGMRERASALGGKIEVNSAPGSGTTILFEADVSSLPRDDHAS